MNVKRFPATCRSATAIFLGSMLFGCRSDLPPASDAPAVTAAFIAEAADDATHVQILKVRVVTIRGNRFLQFDLRVRNIGREEFKYSSWNDGGFGYGATLEDEAGKRYVRSQFGHLGTVQRRLKAGEELMDRLWFRASEEETAQFRLQLRDRHGVFTFLFAEPAAGSRHTSEHA